MAPAIIIQASIAIKRKATMVQSVKISSERIARNAWGRPCPRLEKAGAYSSSPGLGIQWRMIGRGGEGVSGPGLPGSVGSSGGSRGPALNRTTRHNYIR